MGVVMWGGRRQFLTSICGVLAFCSVAQAADNEVVVLTSYPEEMTVRYEEAFERAHPGIDMRIVWQQGRDAMVTLRKPDRGKIDVYWSPAGFNFPTLATEGAFQELRVDRTKLPGKISNLQISDLGNHYEAFEVAGYGLAVNRTVLAKHRVPEPGAWAQLAKPELAALTVLPVPSQVGFAPGLYDVILQSEGWDSGWALLSETAALARLADRGQAILAPLLDGEAAIAAAIDFLPRNAIAEGQPLTLTYPARTAFLPAFVAIVTGAPNEKPARAFADFVLSAEGQELLFRREVNRYPVRPEAYAKAPAGTVDPFSLPAVVVAPYDASIGPARGPLIAALFDAAIVSRLEKVREVWRAIHAAEAKGVTAATKEARALASWIPVTSAEASDRAFIDTFAGGRQGASADPRIKAWMAALDERQAKALALVR